MKELLQTALEAARRAGAEFAEARWTEYRIQYIGARNSVLADIHDYTESGLSVRAFYNGAWGQSSTSDTSPEEAKKIAEKAVETAKSLSSFRKNPLRLTPVAKVEIKWSSEYEIDPFDISIGEKNELLMAVNKGLTKKKEIPEAYSSMMFIKRRKLYMNSIGTNTDQTTVMSDVQFQATAVGNERFTTRTFEPSPKQKGYEYIKSIPLLENVDRVAEEAVELLTAKAFNESETDLILLPTHTKLTIHETIGHALELDRVLGWEADYAGTSFAVPKYLNNLEYGSSIFSVTADRTQPGGLATCAYDDEGVKTGEWKLIDHGILKDYATTRDTAPIIGRDESRGCAFGESWYSYPILRMANVCIDPGDEKSPSLEELISDTKNGVLIDGTGSFSIDQQRINFQFGGDMCRRIHNGKVGEALWNFKYEGVNPYFWRSVDAVCRPDEWRQMSLYGCAKGQPVQTAALTHGSAPLRLRKIKVVE